MAGIIIGKICGAVVKGLAGATIAQGVKTGIGAVITNTGVLEGATEATKMVVSVGTTAVGVGAGCAVVNKLVDVANESGTPIVGKNVVFAEPVKTYNKHGVLVGVPEHKKNDNKIKVEIIGQEI